MDAADRWLQAHKKRNKRKKQHKRKKTKRSGIGGYAQRDSILRELHFKSYSDYLKSLLWSSVRQRVIERDKICRICDQDGSHCHHITYSKDTLSGTNIDGVVLVCKSCHIQLEFRPNGRKRPFAEVRSMTLDYLSR